MKTAKQKKEEAAEIAQFSKKRGAQWYTVKKMLQEVQQYMDENNLYSAEFEQIEQLIGAAGSKGSNYWKDYYKNK